MRQRIASPELLPTDVLLPHLECSRRGLGASDEESEYGHARGVGGGVWRTAICFASELPPPHFPGVDHDLAQTHAAAVAVEVKRHLTGDSSAVRPAD